MKGYKRRRQVVLGVWGYGSVAAVARESLTIS